jgi:signal transduction histidine kinase
MEEIGTLAAGIAHELNNVLFPIIGYSEISMYNLPEDSGIKGNLEKILEAADRAKYLVQQISDLKSSGRSE